MNVSNKMEFKLKKSSCILIISVRQKYNEANKLLATLNSINTYFKFCKIMLTNTLKRHALSWGRKAFDIDSLKLSKLLGNEWITRNRSIIENSLRFNYNIMRWDILLNSSQLK